ncbi:unnamed protein product, partial [Closterium sp. Naga37s-1]
AALKECAAEWGMSTAEWAQGADCAQAEPILCDKDGMVTELHLNSKQLNGSIPLALTALSHLKSLDLQSNSLSGPVPSALSALRLLTSLRLSSNNNLTGPIFTVIARMPSLVQLEIDSNSFTGPIPLTVSRLQNLSSLDMNNNDLLGPLPPAFFRLTALANLRISSTGLSGPLLNDITGLSSLELLYATSNNISGSIPSTISALSRLTELSLDDNPLLSGSLPRTLSRLTTLGHLLMSHPLPLPILQQCLLILSSFHASSPFSPRFIFSPPLPIISPPLSSPHPHSTPPSSTLSDTNISGEPPRFLTALTRLTTLCASPHPLHTSPPSVPLSLSLRPPLSSMSFQPPVIPSNLFTQRVLPQSTHALPPVLPLPILPHLPLPPHLCPGREQTGEDSTTPLLKRTPACPHIPLADILRATNGKEEAARGRSAGGFSGAAGGKRQGGRFTGQAGGEQQGGRFSGATGGKRQGGRFSGATGGKRQGGRFTGQAGGEQWAVKRMRRGAHGAESAELEAHVAGLACLVHPNVLVLVGWCCWPVEGEEGEGEGEEARGQEGGSELVLVYKWMERGSLQAALQPGVHHKACDANLGHLTPAPSYLPRAVSMHPHTRTARRHPVVAAAAGGHNSGGAAGAEGSAEPRASYFSLASPIPITRTGRLHPVVAAAAGGRGSGGATGAQGSATPLSLQQRVDVAVGVLLALKAVQSHGQVHGDLKPSNVLLSPSFEARVVDWSVVCMGQRVHVDMGDNGLEGHRKGFGNKGLARKFSLPSGEKGTSSSSSSGKIGGNSGYSWGSGRSGSSISSSSGGEQKVYLLRCTEGHVDPAVVRTGIASPTSDMYSGCLAIAPHQHVAIAPHQHVTIIPHLPPLQPVSSTSPPPFSPPSPHLRPFHPPHSIPPCVRQCGSAAATAAHRVGGSLQGCGWAAHPHLPLGA